MINIKRNATIVFIMVIKITKEINLKDIYKTEHEYIISMFISI